MFVCLNVIDVLSYRHANFFVFIHQLLLLFSPSLPVYSITCVLCRTNGTNKRCWSPVTCRSLPIWKCSSGAFSHWHQGSCLSGLYYFLIVMRISTATTTPNIYLSIYYTRELDLIFIASARISSYHFKMIISCHML